jgi:hypothetical protein
VNNIEIDTQNETIIIRKSLGNNCKTYDISLDLTYNDRKTKDKSAVEEYLKTNRINKLRSFLE